MLALSVRQPYAELILRGVKTIEYRSRSTRIVGERFNLYASKGGRGATGKASAGIWSHDLAAPGEALPPWLLDVAEGMRLFPGLRTETLPVGMIVGSAVIDRVTPGEGASAGYFHWHLRDVVRLDVPRPPRGHPQPVWWRE